MQHVDDQMLADAINSLDSVFDTHDVERRVLRDHPVAVARQIQKFQGQPDVLRQFSATLSRRIGQAFHGQVQKTPSNKVRSPNLGWRKSKNQQWRIVYPTTSVTAR